MAVVRGLALALAFFAASFVLHIVGGATDQSWLFAMAVVLIFLSATGFPAFAAFFGRTMDRALLAIGGVAGVVLTAGALWAANDRSFAWWHAPLAVALVGVVSYVLLAGQQRTVRVRGGRVVREVDAGG
ncbi:MAG TPA: hypothetical protein VIH05_09245 [Tepidiformaceae bacterium]